MCWPEVIATEVIERRPRYPGEPRRKRLSFVRPGRDSSLSISSRRQIEYADPMFINRGMGMHQNQFAGMGQPMMHNQLPPPPPLNLPPPQQNFAGQHSPGLLMQQPFNNNLGHGHHQGGGEDFVQLNGNGGGQFMDQGMHHGGGQFGAQFGGGFAGELQRGTRYINGPSGPRSPMPRGLRSGVRYGGSGGSMRSFMDDTSSYTSSEMSGPGFAGGRSFGSGSVDDFAYNYVPARRYI